MLRLICRIAVLVATFASAGASAEMRDIAVTMKFCGGTDCTDESPPTHWFRIDWPARLIEFRGTTVKAGGTAAMTEPPVQGSTARFTEPTRLRASIEGRRLTLEQTRAIQFDTWFEKRTISYVLEFGPDGECKSFSIANKILEKTINRDTGGAVGVSCRGRIDIPG
jgi:hypothetical protein